MTRTILVLAALALVGCESMKDERHRAGAAPFDPRNPRVFVVPNGATACADKKAAIVVDQEPIYFFGPHNGQAFPITWHLQTRGYSFVQQASISDPPPRGKGNAGEITKCNANGQNMTCINKNESSGYWKYTLRIKADDNCGNPEDLDPLIGND